MHISILEHPCSEVAAAVKAKVCSMHVPMLRCMLCDCSRLLQLHFRRLFDQDLGPTLPAWNQCCEGMVANKDKSLSSDPCQALSLKSCQPAACWAFAAAPHSLGVMASRQASSPVQ